MRATKDVHAHKEEESKCPTQSPKHIKDDRIEQENLSSGTATAKDSYAVISSPTTNESCSMEQTGVDSPMHSRPSTPENADMNDKIKAKEEPSNLEEEKSNLEEETTSKSTLVSSPVVSPMRENISSLRFGNLLHLNMRELTPTISDLIPENLIYQTPPISGRPSHPTPKVRSHLIPNVSFREAELELVVYEEKCIARDTVLMEKRSNKPVGLRM